MVALFEHAREFLQENDPTFPSVDLAAEDIQLRGPGSATADEALAEALTFQQRWPDLDRIVLDATWTATTVATLARDIEMGNLKGQTVLYWHTYNSHPYPEPVAEVDYAQLPHEFHDYFETEELSLENKPVG